MSAQSAAPFATRTVLVLVALAVVGFLSYVLLSAYADDLRPPAKSGTHALSNGATGFAGVVRLARDTGHRVDLVRREGGANEETLLVLTPGYSTEPERVKRVADAHPGLTLVVLPKWITNPQPGKPGWVQGFGTFPPAIAARPVSELAKVSLRDPRNGLRTLDGANLDTLMEAPNGGTLLAQVKGTDILILADPDVLDNLGLNSEAGAERAIQLLDLCKQTDGDIAFDLTLHGFGRNPNLLKLAFEPPFLPLTLCLLAAALLAGWHAMLRFGTPAPEARGIAFGKRAIAENGAALLRLARRRHRTGARYAALTRDAVAAATGAPAGLNGAALDRYLDRLAPESEPFSAMAQRAADAPDTRRLLDAARALHLWRRTVTREHR